MTLREATSSLEAQKQVDEYFDELRSRLLDGTVVPFLGAGISYACKSPETPTFDPTTKSLRESLARWLWTRCETSSDTAKRAGRLLAVPDLHCSQGEDAFINRCNDNNVSLGELAEVCTWLSNPRTVCDVLKIKCFTELAPRPAHRYIAYLVREGLIDQVITTNWDTCLEQALQCSFETRLATPLHGGGASEASTFHVISRIEEYQRWGAYRRVGRGRRRPVLRLYKINGCAAAYQDAPAAEAERIALTERQLQGFRDNHWAADLFRDRARSHRLLFSGFGSAEPQIRHAVMVLAGEFRSGPSEVDGRAPFVQVHEESPTFHQYQLLRAYYREKKRGPNHLRVGLKQVMTGIHADRFPDPKLPCRTHTGSCRAPQDDRLDADRFWFGVYLAAMRGLLQRYCEPGFPFYAWLAQYSLAPAREAMGLCLWLYPRHAADGTGGSPPCERTFGRLIGLFRPTAQHDVPCGWPYANVGCGPMRLWVWLAAIQGRRTFSRAPKRWCHDWYVPMREESLLTLSSLYVLRALVPDLSNAETDHDLPDADAGHPHARDNWHPRVWPDVQDVGLRVRVYPDTRDVRTCPPSGTPDDGTRTPFNVSLVAYAAPQPSRQLLDCNTLRTRIRYEVAVSNRLVETGGMVPRVGRWDGVLPVANDPEGPLRRLRTGRFVRLPTQQVDFGHVREGAVAQEDRAACECCSVMPMHTARTRRSAVKHKDCAACQHRIRTVQTVRLAAARLLPRTRVGLILRAAYGAARK